MLVRMYLLPRGSMLSLLYGNCFLSVDSFVRERKNPSTCSEFIFEYGWGMDEKSPSFMWSITIVPEGIDRQLRHFLTWRKRAARNWLPTLLCLSFSVSVKRIPRHSLYSAERNISVLSLSLLIYFITVIISISRPLFFTSLSRKFMSDSKMKKWTDGPICYDRIQCFPKWAQNRPLMGDGMIQWGDRSYENNIGSYEFARVGGGGGWVKEKNFCRTGDGTKSMGTMI